LVGNWAEQLGEMPYRAKYEVTGANIREVELIWESSNEVLIYRSTVLEAQKMLAIWLIMGRLTWQIVRIRSADHVYI